jgi:hypothetical protein
MRVVVSLEKAGVKDGREYFYFPRGFITAFVQKLIDEFVELRGIDGIKDEESLRAFYEYVYGDEAEWPEFVRRKFEDVLEFINSFSPSSTKAGGAPPPEFEPEPQPEPRSEDRPPEPESRQPESRPKGGSDKAKDFISELKKYRGGFGRK